MDRTHDAATAAPEGQAEKDRRELDQRIRDPGPVPNRLARARRKGGALMPHGGQMPGGYTPPPDEDTAGLIWLLSLAVAFVVGSCAVHMGWL